MSRKGRQCRGRAGQRAEVCLETRQLQTPGEAGLSTGFLRITQALTRAGGANSSQAQPMLAHTTAAPPSPTPTFQALQLIPAPQRQPLPQVLQVRRLKAEDGGKNRQGGDQRTLATASGKSGRLPASARPVSHFPALSH